MDEGARAWMHKTAVKNFWRVARWIDLDDLIQEGYLCYYKIRDRYANATDAPHVMALFKRAYVNHIHTLATRRTRSIVEVGAIDLVPDGSDAGPDGIFASIADEGGMWVVELGAVVASAPAATRAVLEVLLGDGTPLRSAPRRRADGGRETLGERLRRVAGLDDGIDVVRELREFLTARPPADWVESDVVVAIKEVLRDALPINEDVRSRDGAERGLPAVAGGQSLPPAARVRARSALRVRSTRARCA